ncbi:S-type pyocin domain-containing protein [Serratia oryzae]|uniref:S-type pyocin domain-containing protein n=1 Tax=Serratia oryzae TaxID=2034155 RepID=UPI001F4F9DD7|nr:S-type pyocin domain-containing protein [Serratia oryzae]
MHQNLPQAGVSTVGSTVGALVAGFWPTKVGEGGDRVLGRDIEMFAAQAQLFAAGKVNIQPEMTSVNLPVRGFITVENGRQYAALVKTGINGVSANVPVLRAVRDEKTGLDKITLPAVGGVPTRTVLINPVPTGPAPPPHTGTEIKQVASIVTTPYPADDLKDIQDFIYWQPDAAGTGVEPIYVMLSGPPKSFTHGYKHYPPKGVPWKDIVNSTANGGHAKFKSDVNIPEVNV